MIEGQPPEQTQNPFASLLPSLQEAVTIAQLGLEETTGIHDPDLRMLEQEQAGKDLQLAQKRLRYAQEGRHPNIPIYELRIAHVEEQIAQKRAELHDSAISPDTDLKNVESHELELHLHMLENRLRIELQELNSLL